jgi:hypothetical protein
MVRRYFYFDTTYRTCTNRELPIPRISPTSFRPRELPPLVAVGSFLLRSNVGGISGPSPGWRELVRL